MKSFLKITFIVFLYSKNKVNGIYWSVLTLLVSMALSGCKADNETANPFPVNETFAMKLIGKGIPADIAPYG